MAAPYLSDVYTLDEVARAAHVPRRAVDERLASSDYRLFDGFLAPADALALALRLRAAALRPLIPPAP